MRQNANVKQYSGVYNILCIGDFLKCVIGALLAVVQNSPSDLLDSVFKNQNGPFPVTLHAHCRLGLIFG